RMHDAVAAVVEELQRLRRSGVSSVYVSDEALDLLRHTGAAAHGTGREPAPVSADPSPAGSVEEPAVEAVPAIPPQYAGTTGAAAAASFSKLLATIEQTPAHPSMKKAAS